MTPWERVEAHVYHLRESLSGIEQAARQLSPAAIRAIVREEIREALAPFMAEPVPVTEPEPDAPLVDVLHRQKSARKKAGDAEAAVDKLAGKTAKARRPAAEK